MGWRWRDADGDLANGPYTKPGGGCPRPPVTLQPPGQLELPGLERNEDGRTTG